MESDHQWHPGRRRHSGRRHRRHHRDCHCRRHRCRHHTQYYNLRFLKVVNFVLIVIVVIFVFVITIIIIAAAAVVIVIMLNLRRHHHNPTPRHHLRTIYNIVYVIVVAHLSRYECDIDCEDESGRGKTLRSHKANICTKLDYSQQFGRFQEQVRAGMVIIKRVQ